MLRLVLLPVAIIKLVYTLCWLVFAGQHACVAFCVNIAPVLLHVIIRNRRYVVLPRHAVTMQPCIVVRLVVTALPCCNLASVKVTYAARPDIGPIDI